MAIDEYKRMNKFWVIPTNQHKNSGFYYCLLGLLWIYEHALGSHFPPIQSLLYFLNKFKLPKKRTSRQSEKSHLILLFMPHHINSILI